VGKSVRTVSSLDLAAIEDLVSPVSDASSFCFSLPPRLDLTPAPLNAASKCLEAIPITGRARLPEEGVGTVAGAIIWVVVAAVVAKEGEALEISSEGTGTALEVATDNLGGRDVLGGDLVAAFTPLLGLEMIVGAEVGGGRIFFGGAPVCGESALGAFGAFFGGFFA